MYDGEGDHSEPSSLDESHQPRDDEQQKEAASPALSGSVDRSRFVHASHYRENRVGRH